MSNSATRAKARYNDKNYVQINLKLSPELAARFDAARAGGSYPQALVRALDALDKYDELKQRAEKLTALCQKVIDTHK